MKNIKCNKIYLEQRCQQRGYKIEDVMPCVISQEGDIWTIDTDHPSYPKINKNFIKPPPPPPEITEGPGTELKKLLSKIGINAHPDCSCNQRARIMNENGIDWCEQNIETICDWMAEESAKRNLPFVRTGAKIIINLAIRRAKKLI